MQSSKRRPMIRLSKMTQGQFDKLMEAWKTYGCYRILEKVDGDSVRFGRDYDGKLFFENSKSGPVYEFGGFSDYCRRTGGSFIERAKHYDDMMELVLKHKVMNWVPNGTRVFAEALYRPMAEYDDDRIIRWHKTEYKSNWLAPKLTLCVFKVEQDLDLCNPFLMDHMITNTDGKEIDILDAMAFMDQPRKFDPSGDLEADKQRFADHIMASPQWFKTSATVGGPVESWVLQIGQMTVNMDLIPV